MKAKSLKNLSRRPMLLAMLTLFCLLAGGLNLKAQNRSTLTVYDQNTTTNEYVPIDGYDANYKSKCEFIIPAGKLSAMNGGVISAMKFYLSSSGGYNQISATFNVFVKEVNTTTLTGFTGTTNATSVYTSTISIPENQSNFVLDIPFSSNYIYGGGNLLIGFYQTTTTGYNFTDWTGEDQDTNTAWGGYDGSTSGRKFLPKTTFTYEIPTTPTIILPATATVLTGSTETLTATTFNVTGTPSITYSSSNTGVATVTGSGTTATVTGVAPGTATITATMTYDNNTYTATCAVTVENPSYCTPSFSYTSDYIKSFVTTGGTTNIDNTNTGQGTGGYSDYYNSHSASIEVGQTLSFTVTKGNTYSYKYAIWVDWNHDYVFDVNTETVAQQTTSVSSDWSSSFTIPANTAAGDYRMRVEMLDGNTLDPCVSATYGEVEDYKLTVLASGAYTVTCADATGGTVTATPTHADDGATITVTATPEGGYTLTSLSYTTDGGTTVVITGNTFTMPADNVTVYAVFTANTSYNITYNVSTAGTGTATATGPASAPWGSKVTVTTTPASGYVFDHLTVTGSGGNVTASGKTFTMPQYDVTVTAYFVEGGSGTDGSVVTLDDRENHSWSYYSDGNQPIHRLEPIDVKITYYGNGQDENNMTTTDANDIPTTFGAKATGVQVNVGETETEHTFVYYKTLENAKEDGTGNYPYTLIPNPFQVRPTYGSGSTRYRGFYAWRVKRLSNGLTITDSNNNTYGEGSIIYADQEVEFITTSEYGNEVEFEALWAKAYVTDGTTSLTDYVSRNTTLPANYKNVYERNFHVLTGSTSASNLQKTYPLTITSYYPDGTSAGGSLKGGYTASADTKIENVSVSNATTSTWSGNAHNFAVGRGVTGTVETIQGLSSSSTSTFNFRVESGTYDNLYFMGDGGLTTGGKMTAIMGSDYDRAIDKENANPKLKINTNILVSYGGTVGSSQTVGEERFRCTVKSGNYDLGTYAGNSQFYLSSPNGTMYAGRSLVIEGGLFSDISGGWDKEVTSVNHNKVSIRIKGGTIKGAVYGAAQHSNSYGNRRIVITGGDFSGWIAGGCNGTFANKGELNGLAYIYMGGKAILEATDDYLGGETYDDNDDPQGVNGAYSGYIFGAGCGIAPNGFDETAVNPDYTLLESNTVGKVYGSRIVIADECEVGRDVYGGGNFGFVAGSSGDMGLSGNTDKKTEIYMLGGTIHGDIQGGSNNSNGQTVNIYIKGGELVGRTSENPQFPNNPIEGSVYGGSDTWGTINGPATITMTGGHIHGSVFGGGYGSHTDMKAGTFINISGGTIDQNVYGGGEEGTVTAGNTNITVSGGTMVDVFGAGKGSSSSNAMITGQTHVDITGGSMTNVYGGGELGKSTTSVINMYGGSVNGNIFGGALGTSGSVMMTGNKTVNIMGGAVKGSVYGGSRNANDSNDSYVNISGGTIDKHVYGGGFYGSITGNTYVNIGKDAILNSPCKATNTYKPSSLSVGSLNIGGSVYAGSDWGEFTAGSTFTPSNITGASNIYVDANGYSDGSLIIGNSIYGSGTSGDAGTTSRDIIIRNYGTMTGTNGSSASRKLYTIQRADRVILDNAHIELTGKGNIASASTTEQFGISDIFGEFRMANGSSLVLDAPVDNTKAAGSYVCANTFAASPTYTPVTIDDLSTAAKDNKIYFKDGCYLNVYYKNGTDNLYGALSGYFHMTAENTSVGFAYARPKVVSGSIAATYWPSYVPLNENDGGFVSYTASENEYDINGNTTGDLVQVQYILHPNTRDDSQYYRTWMLGTGTSKISKVITAEVNGTGTDDILTATVNAQLPYANGCYYKIIDVDWGDDAAMVNAGLYETDKYALCHKSGGNYVMAYNQTASACVTEIDAIQAAPNYTFGLTVLPEAGFQSDFGSSMPAALISPDAEDLWDKMNVVSNTSDKPELQFMLTYANNIDASASLSPVVITLEEYDCDDNKLQNVEVSLTIQTITQIQDIETTVYAMMYGPGYGTTNDSSTVKVVLPKFVMASGATYSQFSITGVTITSGATGATSHASTWFAGNTGTTLDYGMTYKPALTTDEINGWYGANDIKRCFDASAGAVTDFATADGRELTAIDFTVHYDGRVHFENDEDELATKVFAVSISNFVEDNVTITKTFNITVHIRRRGQAQNWYISSEGSNANSGQYPDKPKRTIKALMNAKPAYAVGDNIFVVDTVNINTTTAWDGCEYGGINIYRYPGGHKLSTGLTDDPANTYKGAMFIVNDNLTADSIYIDGMYGCTDTGINPSAGAEITANGPVFVLNNGAKLIFRNGSIKNNHVVTSGSKADEAIAGGVYMGGEMTVDGLVTINDNYLGTAKSNVYLPNADSKIAIENELETGSQIGVTKTAMPEGAAHTPIAYSPDENNAMVATTYGYETFVPDANGVFTYYNSVETEDTNPYTIYFALTWVAAVTSQPSTFVDATPIKITCENDLAWFISYVNGYNGSETHAGATAKVTKDLDMNRYIWVPIGDAETAFKGSFDGNMQTIANLHCNETDGISDKFDYMGMFGQTSGATVQNTFVIDADFASSKAGSYMGGLIGKATSGTIEFCEAAGTLTALADLTSMGGVVGSATGSTLNAVMAVGDITVNGTDANVGAITGNGGTVKTFYANQTISGDGAASAVKNTTGDNGYCIVSNSGYDMGTTGFSEPTAYTYGSYATNNTLSDGTPLVDALNDDNNLASGYKWIRPAGSVINNDYPIIVKTTNDGSAVVNETANGKVVRYGEINGLIAMEKYQSTDHSIFMYNNDELTNAPVNTKLYIDEHVALTQADNISIPAYVGITFDNSNGVLGEESRDWHMFSSTIAAGKIGIEYDQTGPFDHPTNDNDLTFGNDYSMVENDNTVYFPDGITAGSQFDLYSFFEPQYHWINLKRATGNHWHQDNTDNIDYTGSDNVDEATFTVGKGYLIALGDKTNANNNLMQAYGTLNNGQTNIDIPVTVSGAHLTGYNLLGNPFQSYLDFSKFATANSSIWGSESANNGYIIYDADKGGFICYGEGLQGVQPSMGSATAGQYLHPHQGFLVLAENAGTVKFNNGMRSTNASNVEFRNEQPAYPVVNLFCTDSEGNNEITVVEIERPETAGVRKPKGLLNGDGQMYAHWNNTDYGLLFIDHTPDYVPMWFDAIKDAVFTMTWSTANDNFGYLHLIDNMTGADIDCLVDDSYVFSATTTDMSARFRLVFKPLGVPETPTEQGENFAFINGEELIVNGEGELSFVDLNGHVLARQYVTGQQTRLAIPKVAVGMYMLTLTGSDGVKVQKIVIRK